MFSFLIIPVTPDNTKIPTEVSSKIHDRGKNIPLIPAEIVFLTVELKIIVRYSRFSIARFDHTRYLFRNIYNIHDIIIIIWTKE